MTLTDFLLARIAEDEEVARKATGNPADWLPEFWDLRVVRTLALASVLVVPVAELSTGAILLTARYNPERVLAECEAKRRIVKRHTDCGTGHGYCDDGGHGWGSGGDDTLGCADLADIAAAVYADHPDYREEWRP